MEDDAERTYSTVSSLEDAGVYDGLEFRLQGGTDEATAASTRNPYDDEDEDSVSPGTNVRHRVIRWIKLAILMILWFGYTFTLMFYEETEETHVLLAIPGANTNETNSPGRLDYPLAEGNWQRVCLRLSGPFSLPALEETPRALETRGRLLTARLMRGSEYEVSEKWEVFLQREDWRDFTPMMTLEEMLTVSTPTGAPKSGRLSVRFETTTSRPVAVHAAFQLTPPTRLVGSVVALCIIFGAIALIVGHVCDYTVAAMITSTVAVSMLAFWGMRPLLSEFMMWLQVDLLLLLFCVRLVTALCADSGLFDVFVLYAYRFTNGHIWPLLHFSIVVTPIMSLVLGGVTTVLLLTPIHIRYCEALDLDPIPVLIILILFSMTSGGLYPYENALRPAIGMERETAMAGITVSAYLTHIVPALAIVLLYTYIHLRLRFIDSTHMRHEDAQLHRLQRVIRVYRHAAKQISGYSKNEQMVRDTLLTKVTRLRQRVHRLGKMPIPAADYARKLEQLKATAEARDRPLVRKCIIALSLLFVLSALEHWPAFDNLSQGWTTLLIALLLLILTDVTEVEGLISRVDWSPLLFIAAMCVYAEVAARLGLHDYITEVIANTVHATEPDYRLAVAILLVLWTSALGSAILIDNWLMRFLLPLIVNVAQDDRLNLPLEPLFWAVVLGAAVGSSGTMVGGAANVACAGIAEKHGYFFGFAYYLKIAGPITLVNLVLVSIYLVVCHVTCEWH